MVVSVRGSGNGCEVGDRADGLKGLCLCVGFLKVLLFGGGQWNARDVQRGIYFLFFIFLSCNGVLGGRREFWGLWG